jgi:Cytochrome c7 and related cytochrome c
MKEDRMSTIRNGHIHFTLGSAVLLALVMLPAASAISQQLATTSSDLATRGCEMCHDDTTLITGRRDEWSMTRHATGTSFASEGGNPSCAGCHSGGTFVTRVLAGLDPDEVTQGDPHPTRQECRTCHQIHVTYTEEDWALETTAPVTLFAVPGAKFDKGEGNLCVNCHQPRRDFPQAVNGVISGISTHWGPHHGPQSAMMLGVAGSVKGSPAFHYTTTAPILANGCVSCHMGPDGKHDVNEPKLEVCQNCHNTNSFDVDGVQTLNQKRLDLIGAKLVELGVLNENSSAGHPTVTSAAAPIATALYDWLYMEHEDGSLGVHNPPYYAALCADACSKLGISCP